MAAVYVVAYLPQCGLPFTTVIVEEEKRKGKVMQGRSNAIVEPQGKASNCCLVFIYLPLLLPESEKMSSNLHL